MLLKVSPDSTVGPIPAFTGDRTDAFPVYSSAEGVAELAAQLNGTSSSGQFYESVAAYRATHQPGDRYLVGAVVVWQ